MNWLKWVTSRNNFVEHDPEFLAVPGDAWGRQEAREAAELQTEGCGRVGQGRVEGVEEDPGHEHDDTHAHRRHHGLLLINF